MIWELAHIFQILTNYIKLVHYMPFLKTDNISELLRVIIVLLFLNFSRVDLLKSGKYDQLLNFSDFSK